MFEPIERVRKETMTSIEARHENMWTEIDRMMKSINDPIVPLTDQTSIQHEKDDIDEVLDNISLKLDALLADL